MIYGYRYKAVRIALDLTQMELCKRLEIKVALWSYLENKAKNIDVAVAQKLIGMGANPLFMIIGEEPVLLPHVNIPEKEAGPRMQPSPGLSPIAFMETLKNTQAANEIEIKTLRTAYIKLAEAVLPHLARIDNYLSQLAKKKITFNLVET